MDDPWCRPPFLVGFVSRRADAARLVRRLLVPRRFLLGSLFVAPIVWSFGSQAEERSFIILATTVSVRKSGLLDFLLPVFTRRTGVEVYMVAVGTIQALKSGELGECDVLLVHDRQRELQFMQNGFGSVRRDVMYDDYILVGPEEDPAKIGGMHDARAALRKIAEAHALFISRGDRSTTDTIERGIWAEALSRSVPDREPWHLHTGASLQQTLATAASMNGYSFVDRATWAKFSDRGHLKIVVESDARMIDQYSAILVNPAKHPQVKAELGMAFIEWLTSKEGQDTIASYKVENEELFFPDYVKP